MARVTAFLVALACLVLSADGAAAQSLFERLVMPGPLSKAHAKEEKTCNKCHVPFKKEAQSSLCLECHEKIKLDREAGKGFHGKHPRASKQECRQCHVEHKGRGADVVGLDKQTFDHRFTNYHLTGQHARTPCASCHAANVAYRKAPTTCIGCHRRDDNHKGRLGETCNACHTTDSWKKRKAFDHTRTRFALVGAHAKVACRTCHVGEVYKGLERTCVGCHAVQDVHKGKFGPKCESCHQPRTWKTVRFDHARDTRFPLKGRHAEVACKSCHRGDPAKEKLATNCASCHGRQDPHRGQLGTRCENCHSESGWRKAAPFDHDTTKFPLIGLHAVVTCEACHKSKAFRSVPTACGSCHQDTAHKGNLGSNCARCHTPNGWRRWLFDHAKAARFPLTGAHQTLDCLACHRTPAAGRVTAPRTCVGCHRQDDAHSGAFGSACESCHTTTTFRRGRLTR